MVRASGLRTVEELSEAALRVHPRAKLTVTGRRLLVERVLDQAWPVVRAAEAQGVSVATAYKWVRRWRAEGLAVWLTAAVVPDQPTAAVGRP